MKILIGSPCRANEQWQMEAFQHYIESLDNLEKPVGATIDRLFLLHNSPHLLEHVREGPIETGMQYIAEIKTPDQYQCDEKTHDWKTENLLIVASMRNYILDFARKQGYDYYFMVDSDLVLHPKTLINLIEAQKDIVSEVFWTRWTPEDIESPNAWDYDTYSFHESAELRMKQFREPGLYRIGMTGACILLSKPVIQSNVSYDPIQNVTFWGEDRYFCIRAACNGFEIWLDTHYPPVHLYRPSDLNKYVENGGYQASFSI